jgi:aryl-alcohol dehydrogenase-like predicted oxidoreductase
MRYKEKYGMKLSAIGLGTGRFGTVVSRELSYEMLDTFYQRGGNVIDTARNYYEWVENGRGKSEETIGAWMADRKLREQVYISTKGGVRNEGKQFFMDLSERKLLEECRQSLDALQTDYIDIYLLHRDEPQRPVEEIVDSLQAVRECAKVKALGVCNWSADRVKHANAYAQRNHLTPIQIVQTWWSIAAYTPDMWNDPTTTWMDEEMYDYLFRENMLGMAFTSQAKGFFQKAIKGGYENVDEFLKHRIATEENLRRLEIIKKYCETYAVSPTAVVTGYITENAVDGIALVSCSKLEQLTDIMDNVDVEVDRKWLEQFREDR